MSLAILHLSDTHFRSKQDKALTLPSVIAQSCAEKARRAEILILALTGDIAYSGSSEEYKVAREFIEDIKSQFTLLGCVVHAVVMVPGNHDCVLVPEDKVRSIVINSVIEDASQARDAGVIATCVQPQEHYFRFRDGVSELPPKLEHPLWMEYEIIVDAKPVRISAINAAWMSRLPEIQGSLVFPTALFEDVMLEPASLRIALIHHPVNWYAQSSYHELRKHLRTHFNVVLSGHEHMGSVGSSAEVGVGEIVNLEAYALQPGSESEPSGYSFTVIDLSTGTAEVSQYRVARGKSALHSSSTVKIDAALSNPANEAQLQKSFVEVLSNPGGSFVHPDRENIQLEDIFVFPELRALDVSDDDKIQQPRNAESVLLDSPLDVRALVLAEEKGGKTALLFASFRRIHAAGHWPLYIQAGRLKKRGAAYSEKILRKIAAEQYRDPNAFLSAPPSKKVLLLDDLDQLPGGARALLAFVETLSKEFSGIIATAARGFELQGVLLPEATTALKGFRRLELTRFGHVLRHRLIRKWCENGNWSSVSDLDRDVHAAEELINKVLGKNLAPALPMYLLILLQSWSQQQQGEIQNSSFARYYEYLMTRSLVRTTGFGRDEYDELFNYLSQMAWYFWDAGIESATYTELVSFNNVFCQKFATVDLDRRLGLLVDARLLAKRVGGYEFAYPYVFFFFLGRWLARNLEEPDVRRRVEECSRRLDIRKNASAILFLSYHSNNRWIIETIAKALVECLPPCSTADLDADVAFINELADSSATILIDSPDIERNQTHERKLRDGIALLEQEDEIEDALDADEEVESVAALLRRIQLLFATAEILGQIIKNYYGSLERDVKEENLSQVIGAPLRVIRWFFEAVGKDPEGFVMLMEQSIEKERRKSLTPSELRLAARDLAYNLLGLIATGLILRGGAWVASRRIVEDVENVVSADGTVGKRLVQAASRLILPGELPHDQIRRLARDLKNNPFAFRVLQSIGVRHIHLFFVSAQDRQKLCEALRIEFRSSSFIDLATKENKILPR